MNLIVCIKEVPDPEARAEKFTVDSTEKKVTSSPGVKRVISPFDENAIEAALQLKEARGGTVTVLTLGPRSSVEALKRGLRMGADRAVLVDAGGAADPDADSTAYLLAKTIEKTGAYDLILCGRQAADWDQGVIGCYLAETLGIPCVTIVRKIEVIDSGLRVERLVEDGYEVVELPMPALLTVTNEINQPRLTSVAGILRASTMTIPVWSAQDIGAEPAKAGSCTKMLKLVPPEIKGQCQIIQGKSPEEAATNLVKTLKENKII